MAILGGAIGFCIGVKLYYNAEYEKAMVSFQQYITKKKLDAQKGRASQPVAQGQTDDNEGSKSDTEVNMWAKLKKMVVFENENDKMIAKIK